MRNYYIRMRGCFNCMLEPPTSGDLPWMVNAPFGEWIKFHVKQESLDKTENDQGWSCYTGDMRFPGEEYEDEVCEIPFWAMVPFFDAYVEQDKESGWAYYRFKAAKHPKGREATIEVFKK